MSSLIVYNSHSSYSHCHLQRPRLLVHKPLPAFLAWPHGAHGRSASWPCWRSPPGSMTSGLGIQGRSLPGVDTLAIGCHCGARWSNSAGVTCRADAPQPMLERATFEPLCRRPSATHATPHGESKSIKKQAFKRIRPHSAPVFRAAAPRRLLRTSSLAWISDPRACQGLGFAGLSS